MADTTGWFTRADLADMIAVSESTPGPIGVNMATYAGFTTAGIPGALIATLGLILPSLIIVSLLAYVYRRYSALPMLQSVLASLRPAVVALIAAAGLNMLLQVAFGGRQLIALENAQWAGIALFAAAFLALRKWKANPILTMVLCGAGGLALGLLGLF